MIDWEATGHDEMNRLYRNLVDDREKNVLSQALELSRSEERCDRKLLQPTARRLRLNDFRLQVHGLG